MAHLDAHPIVSTAVVGTVNADTAGQLAAAFDWCHLQFNEKKCSREMQTLHAGCSKASAKILPHHRPLAGGAGQPKFNQLEMVTIFTYKPSLVKIDAHSFELSW